MQTPLLPNLPGLTTAYTCSTEAIDYATSSHLIFRRRSPPPDATSTSPTYFTRALTAPSDDRSSSTALRRSLLSIIVTSGFCLVVYTGIVTPSSVAVPPQFVSSPPISEEAGDKVLEVEQKYNELRRPVYKKRNEIIQSIPDFWLTANFSTNPYFEGTKLSKFYTFFDDGTTNIAGTSIKWKEGMTQWAVDIQMGANRPISPTTLVGREGLTKKSPTTSTIGTTHKHHRRTITHGCTMHGPNCPGRAVTVAAPPAAPAAARPRATRRPCGPLAVQPHTGRAAPRSHDNTRSAVRPRDRPLGRSPPPSHRRRASTGQLSRHLVPRHLQNHPLCVVRIAKFS
ncbi:hypothetical protein KSP40_PGU008416 [Platanthera guangdongensis]|uniref:Uncharacterized protein n=1 Tax=Platanthera guangdongensis TaxID=2320717 RepID=A0ABR2LI68_9ASPA